MDRRALIAFSQMALTVKACHCDAGSANSGAAEIVKLFGDRAVQQNEGSPIARIDYEPSSPAASVRWVFEVLFASGYKEIGVVTSIKPGDYSGTLFARCLQVGNGLYDLGAIARFTPYLDYCGIPSVQLELKEGGTKTVDYDDILDSDSSIVSLEMHYPRLIEKMLYTHCRGLAQR